MNLRKIVHNGTYGEKAELAIALGFDCSDYVFVSINNIGVCMKNYIKIFVITLIFQIGWIGIDRVLYPISFIFSEILVYGLFLVFPLSIVIDIVLAVRWGRDKKEKLLCIFLMPTNYTWVLMIWWGIWLLKKFMDAMSDFVSSWG